MIECTQERCHFQSIYSVVCDCNTAWGCIGWRGEGWRLGGVKGGRGGYQFSIIFETLEAEFPPFFWFPRLLLQSYFKPHSSPLVHRVDRVISFHSSRPNWDSPTPSPANECAPTPPLVLGGGGTLARGRGGGGANSNGLGIYVLCSLVPLVIFSHT
jgi:hypothetical protein